MTVSRQHGVSERMQSYIHLSNVQNLALTDESLLEELLHCGPEDIVCLLDISPLNVHATRKG